MTLKPKNPIKDIIENSGNNHHYQVVEFLRDKKWAVLVSPYYNDKFTDKPRVAGTPYTRHIVPSALA